MIAPCRCLACQSPISHHHDMPARRTIGRSSLLWAALCSFALMLSFAFACRIEDDNQFAQEEEIAARFARAICESGRSCSCEVSVNCEEGVQSIVDGQRLSAVAAGLNYSSQCVEQQIAQLDESFCGVDTSEAPPCAVWYGDGKPGDPCEWISDNEFHAWLPAWTCRQGSSCIGGVCSPDLPGELHEAEVTEGWTFGSRGPQGLRWV